LTSKQALETHTTGMSDHCKGKYPADYKLSVVYIKF